MTDATRLLDLIAIKMEWRILLYVRKDIPAKILSQDFPSAESFFCLNNTSQKEMAFKLFNNPNKNNIISKALIHFLQKTKT